MTKADYSKIADSYDKGTTLLEYNMSMWLEKIVKYSQNAEGRKLLDLGCGTGRFSIPLSERLEYSVVGVDSSKHMLEKAKQKDYNNSVTWLHDDVCSLSFQDRSFDIAYMSHLLHHIDDRVGLIKSCYRILKNQGVVIIRYGAIDQIRNDTVHSFFPQVIEIDDKRTPTKENVEKLLLMAGFKNVASEEVHQKSFTTVESMLESIKQRSISILNLISEHAFNTGMKKLYEYVYSNPNEKWLLFDDMTITVGTKST